MDFSKLSKADRNLLILAVVVAVTGLTSVIDDWGPGVVLSLLAGIGLIFVLLQPQLAPTMKLPATKEMSILALSAIAAAGFLLGALIYLGAIFNVGRVYNIFFDVGLVASIVLTYLAYMRYKAAGGTLSMGTAGGGGAAAAPAAPAEPSPAPMAEPMAEPASAPMAEPSVDEAPPEDERAG